MIKDAYGNTRFYGVYRGVVTDVADPLGKKRLRLKVPQILADNETQWAWPAIAPGTTLILPSVGDGVWVMFEGGDPSFPIWNGSFNEIVPLAASITVGAETFYGIPDGGTTGQLLAKIDDKDYNVHWINEAPAASFTSTVKHQVKAGEALTKGQAVYVSSADGTNMIVSKASNTTENTSSKTMGLIESSLALNGKGNVVTEGLLAGLNTAEATAGDTVWLGTSGNLLYGLANKPVASNHLVFIGIVTRANANNGEIFVKVQNGVELNELHDVKISGTIANNEVIAYTSSTSLWENKTAAEAGLATSSDLSALSSTVSLIPTNKNYIINGAFDIWQRGTSFASQPHLAYSADRWRIAYDGTGARTVSRQSFTLGSAPDSTFESQYFYRCQQTTAGTGGTYNDIAVQSIEDVRTLAGKTVTVSFWAKSNASRNFTFFVSQNFGTGGSPSSTVNTQGPSTIPVTTSWARYSATVTVPSIAGKTLGTNNDSSLQLIIRSLSINVTQTNDIFGVQVEEGSVATLFRRNSPSIASELEACKRYYENFSGSEFTAAGYANTVNNGRFVLNYVEKRTVPAISASGGASTFAISRNGTDPVVASSAVSFSIGINLKNCIVTIATSSGLSPGEGCYAYGISPANIEIDAEL